MKMCLKANVVGNNDILSKKINKQCDEIIKILEEGKLQENFESYELVRQQGYYNMFDERARELILIVK